MLFPEYFLGPFDFRYQDFMNILVYRFKGWDILKLDGLSILPAQFVEHA